MARRYVGREVWRRGRAQRETDVVSDVDDFKAEKSANQHVHVYQALKAAGSS